VIAIYTRDVPGSEPMLRFEYDSDLESAFFEVAKRYPEYLGEAPAPNMIGRIIGWFARPTDGRMCGVGYDLLPEPTTTLTP